MGFGYDAEQGIFYSLMDSWQRDANFISQYDKYAAIFGNMRYLTTTVDFYYDGLDWRIQLWKGQYGPFGGGEVGVTQRTPRPTISFTIVPTTTICSICITICI